MSLFGLEVSYELEDGVEVDFFEFLDQLLV